jgi:hypothetical protein
MCSETNAQGDRTSSLNTVRLKEKFFSTLFPCALLATDRAGVSFSLKINSSRYNKNLH